MKEIQLQIDVQTLKVYRDNYRQLFKKKFDWRSRYYFEIFVGSYRFVTPVFLLHQTSTRGSLQTTTRSWSSTPRSPSKPSSTKASTSSSGSKNTASTRSS